MNKCSHFNVKWGRFLLLKTLTVTLKPIRKDNEVEKTDLSDLSHLH